MKKTILLSLVAATVLFTACDEKTKNEISDATSSVTSSVKDAASNVADKAGDMKDAAVEKASEVTDVVKEKATNAVEATKDAASSAAGKAVEMKDAAVENVSDVTDTVTKAAVSTAGNETGKTAYAKCAGCHGVDGKTQALGKSAVIAGQSTETLIKSMNEYKAGTRNVAGMGTLMKGQVASMSEDDIKAVAEYISAM